MPKPIQPPDPDNCQCEQPSAAPFHNQATRLTCDLGHAESFMEDQRRPHVPIAAAFGGDRLHTCRLQGSWDLTQMVSDHGKDLCRSILKLPPKNGKDTAKVWDDLTFQLGPQAFLYADNNRIVGFASTPTQAEQLVIRFSKKYHKPAASVSTGGVFNLIQQEGDIVRTKEITLSPETILSPEALRLHYPDGSEKWHQSFVEKLHGRNCGMSIFEGAPGTGKTSYLRHLMGELKKSHRFYFIPTSAMGILSRPDFIGFWTEQRWQHSDRKFVVILEDSDAALMVRGSDNREQVSALLNLSDGMLADFLRLQIHFAPSIAQSLISILRCYGLGRLVCHRVFEPMDYEQAVLLAATLGKSLTSARDYSLAEVFADFEPDETARPRIGFASR